MLKNFSKIFFCFSLIFASCFLFAKSASAATYYVDNTIEDCANYDPTTFTCGSGAYQAYNTVADVQTNVAAGANTIYIRKGQTFTEATRFRPKANWTIDAFGTGNNPILSFSVDYSLDLRTDATGIYFYHLNIQSTSGAVRVYGTGNYDLNMTDVSITGSSGIYAFPSTGPLTITFNLSAVDVVATGVANALVSANNSTFTGTIDSSSFRAGSHSISFQNGIISNLTISNSSASNGTYNGVILTTDIDGLYLTNFTANGNGTNGVAIRPAAGKSQSNIVITGGQYNTNIVHGIGIHADPAGVLNGVTISGADIAYNKIDGINTYGAVDNLVIEKSDIHDNGADANYEYIGRGDGVALHEHATSTVRYNRLYNNYKYQLHSIGDCVTTAYGNLIWSDTDIVAGNLIWVQNDAILNFYNNTVVLNVDSPATGLFLIGSAVTQTQNIKNNIFYGGTYAIDNNSANSPILNIDYNDYFGQTSGTIDGSTDGGHSITSDPGFGDRNNDNLTPKSTSSVFDVGTNLGSDYDDALLPSSTWTSSILTGDQDSFGNGWDIGAYIYTFPLAPIIGTPTAQGSSSIRWNFTDTGTDETGFRIYDNTDNLATSSATANLTYLDETGLSENTQYSGRYATAYNSYGNSASSSAATAIYTLADTPTNLFASSNSNSVTLSVDSFPNDTSGQSGYYFSRSGANSGWIQTNSWTDTGLSCGNEYTYSVKYRNGDGTETSEISTSKSTSGCGGGANPAIWTLPIVPIGGFKMSINGGVVTTTNRNVTLGFNAGADIKKMAISMTGDFTDASQEDYNPTKQWDLCSKLGEAIKNPTCPDGKYTVYAKFYTAYGRTSSASLISSTINLVSTPQISRSVGTFTKNLNLGSKDNQVKALQQFLNQNGYKLADSSWGSPGNETDYFGSLTSVALTKFQEANKDKATGIINEKGFLGPITRQYINSFVSPVTAATPQQTQNTTSVIFTTPLYIGLQSADVRRLQTLLATKPEIYPEGLITGYFGPLTQKAVKNFQLNYGVVASGSDPGFGYVGPMTRAKLQEVFGQ